MPDQVAAQIAKQLADLRLQVNALEVVAKNGSLPEMLGQTRRTILFSALLVAAALLALGVMYIWGNARVRDLQERIEHLERQVNKGP